MKTLSCSLRTLAALAAAGTWTLVASAQTSARHTGPVAGEEVISLGGFTVSAEKSSGYRATNSITATGIGAKISEVPLPITIVTNELINDTAGFELREALNFVPGVLTNARSESTFVVRGFSGLISYRNGQYRRQLFTSYNVDRVEVVKGPASIFFGAVRPGGVINYVTAKPVFSGTFTDVKAQVGTESFYKAEVFHNQKVSEQLALRVGLVGVDSGGTRPFEYKDEYYVGLSASWRPTANQLLTLDLESINRKLFYLSSYGGRAVSNSRYLFNPAVPATNPNTTPAQSHLQSYLRSLGYSTTPGAANFIPTFDIFAPIYGPKDPYGYSVSFSHDAQQRQESKSADLDYLLKIGDRLVWTTNLNYAFDDTAGLQPSDNEQRPYADGTVRFRTEDFINVRDSYNFDNKLTWRFDLGATKHTLQFGQEYQKVVFTRPGWFDSANRYNNSPGNSGRTPYITHYRAGVDAPVSVEAIQSASGQPSTSCAAPMRYRTRSSSRIRAAFFASASFCSMARGVMISTSAPGSAVRSRTRASRGRARPDSPNTTTRSRAAHGRRRAVRCSSCRTACPYLRPTVKPSSRITRSTRTGAAASRSRAIVWTPVSSWRCSTAASAPPSLTTISNAATWLTPTQ